MSINDMELRTIFAIKNELEKYSGEDYVLWSKWAIGELMSLLEKEDYKPEQYKPHEEYVFVDGIMFSGDIEFGRLKGWGWDSGRTMTLKLTPNPPQNSDIVCVDVGFKKLRRFYWCEVKNRLGSSSKNWVAEDDLNGQDIISDWRGMLLTGSENTNGKVESYKDFKNKHNLV
jgi:hypothetical protein